MEHHINSSVSQNVMRLRRYFDGPPLSSLDRWRISIDVHFHWNLMALLRFSRSQLIGRKMPSPPWAAHFMCWFYGLSREFYVRYQMLPRIRRLSENEQTGLYYTVPLLTTQHSLKWRAVKKEEFEFRESYYDFPVL